MHTRKLLTVVATVLLLAVAVSTVAANKKDEVYEDRVEACENAGGILVEEVFYGDFYVNENDTLEGKVRSKTGEWCQRVTELPSGVMVENLQIMRPLLSSFMLVPGENLWGRGLLMILYFVGLMYCFLGIAIIADVFMAAIEVITSQEREVVRIVDGEPQTEVVLVWNATIANLTLMALGSSAPEILLAVIGTASTLNAEPDELGPGTIVGSAAFNLLAITAVCVAGVPEGQFRRIKDISVFYITASASVFAYIWMLIVLVAWTPDEITLAEAIITFAFFPILVSLAFAADHSFFCCGQPDRDDLGQEQVVGIVEPDEEDIQARIERVAELKLLDPNIHSEAEARELAAQEVGDQLAAQHRRRPTRLTYRMNAIRGASGHRRILPRVRETQIRLTAAHHVDSRPPPKPSPGDPVVEFASPSFAVREGQTARVGVRVYRVGEEDLWAADRRKKGGASNKKGGSKASKKSSKKNKKNVPKKKKKSSSSGSSAGESEYSEQNESESSEYTAASSLYDASDSTEGSGSVDVSVHYETRDGMAISPDDYESQSGVLEFRPGQTLHYIRIPIREDNECEPDEEFYVTLSDAEGATLGRCSICTVTVIDVNDAGEFRFSSDRYAVTEGDEFATVTVVRHNGSDGHATVMVKTVDGTAKEGEDYVGVDGQKLEFDHGETSKSFRIEINKDDDVEKEETFNVMLYNPTGGAEISNKWTTVAIVDEDDIGNLAAKTTALVQSKLARFHLGSNDWSQQFVDALTMNGEVEENGDDNDPTCMDYFMHFLTMFWKVIFAFVPPTNYGRGWVTFSVALAMIGVLTGIVGELASLFGQSVGLKDSVTAMTFVALGTSLPDLFASKQATVQEKYADTAIGNVTGSNAVNVFLGLGLPWLIGAIYNTAQGRKYIVPAGSLGFSVTVFTVCALIAIALILFRRTKLGGEAELGGNVTFKFITAGILVSLWMTYVILGSLAAYDHISTF